MHTLDNYGVNRPTSVRSVARILGFSVVLGVSNLLSTTEDRNKEVESYIENITASLTWGKAPANALELAKMMVERFPKTPKSYILRAQAILANRQYILFPGDEEKAKKLGKNCVEYNKYLALKDAEMARFFDKESKETGYFYAQMLSENGRYQDAIRIFNMVLQKYGDDAHVYETLGKSYQENGNYPEAIACYNRAIELGTDSMDIATNLLTAKSALANKEQEVKTGEISDDSKNIKQKRRNKKHS